MFFPFSDRFNSRQSWLFPFCISFCSMYDGNLRKASTPWIFFAYHIERHPWLFPYYSYTCCPFVISLSGCSPLLPSSTVYSAYETLDKYQWWNFLLLINLLFTSFNFYDIVIFNYIISIIVYWLLRNYNLYLIWFCK